MKIEFGNRKALLGLIFIVVGLFIALGIALICAGTLDNLVAGICILTLALWLFIFFILAFRWIGSTLTLKGNELIFRKGICKECRYSLDEIEEIGCEYNFAGGQCINLQLKDGTLIAMQGAKNGWELLKAVRKSVPISAQSKPLNTLEKECIDSRKKRAGICGLLAFFVCLLLVSFFIAVVATDGKEVDFFNEQDWWYFGIFMSFFTIFLFGILVIMPLLFHSIWDVRAKEWAWKRGMVFQNPLAFSSAQVVYTNINIDTRFSFGRKIENGVEEAVAVVESYIIQKGKIDKNVVYFYGEEAESGYARLLSNGALYSIKEIIATDMQE